MLLKIRDNFNKIIFIAGIVAAALLLPEFFSCLFSDYDTDEVIRLIFIALLVAANIFIVLFSLKRKSIGKGEMLIPMALFFGGLVFNDIYLMSQENYYSLIYIFFYIAIVCLYILVQRNQNKITMIYQILLLIFVVMSFTSIFSGYRSMSIFITSLIFLGHHFIRYQNIDKENEEIEE